MSGKYIPRQNAVPDTISNRFYFHRSLQMIYNETPETLLTQAFKSAKLKKLAIVLVFAGILICIVPLLPQVQNLLILYTASLRGGTGNTFESGMRSLFSLPFFG